MLSVCEAQIALSKAASNSFRVCFTGHRPKGSCLDYGLNDGRNPELVEALLSKVLRPLWAHAVTKQKNLVLLTGGALGFDQLALAAGIKLKNEMENERKKCSVTNFVALPCRNMDSPWRDSSKRAFRDLLFRADKVVELQESYDYRAMQKRNEFMVNNAEGLVAFWDSSKKKGGTWNCIRYMRDAKGEGFPAMHVHHETFAVRTSKKGW